MTHIPCRRPRRASLALLALRTAAVGLVTLAPATTAGAADDRPAPVVGAQLADAIDGRYIVVLEDRASAAQVGSARNQAKANGGRVFAEFGAALSGFAAQLPDRAIEALRNKPNVAYIEADQEITLSATQSPATWGLDRVDQRAMPLNNAYTYNATGTGVTAYVIDTGILSSHADFGGRVASGYTAINDGRGTTDCNGHGTHVAGTVGGSTYGVAKQVTLRPVRVLGCTGSGSTPA